MSRSLLAALSAATLSALSCSFVGLPGSPEDALPQLSAPPPSQATAPAPARSVDPAVEGVASFLATRRTGLTREETHRLAETIVAESRRHELEPQLVLAVMHVESRFDSYALSPVGAMGIMQILPSTGEELARGLGIPWHGPRTLFDPIINVRLGVAYLKQLETRFGDVATALAAYNWGPGHIDRRLRRGRALPTEYTSLVLDAHRTKALRTRS